MVSLVQGYGVGEFIPEYEHDWVQRVRRILTWGHHHVVITD